MAKRLLPHLNQRFRVTKFATNGPGTTIVCPLTAVDISISPLQISYLGEPFSLRLPGLDALHDIIRQKGQHCHLFKTDLSRAYHQLRIDPQDYHLLG